MRPMPRPRPMRLSVDGLSIVMGPADGADGYRAILDPGQVREIAAGLLVAADQAGGDAQPALDKRRRYDA